MSTSRPSQSLLARRLRLASGLVLFSFVTTHLANHALGLVSLQLAEQGREVFLAFWRSLPATLVFYGAFALHIALAVAALHDRRTLRMPPLEALRLVVGLAIPVLLAAHFTGTRVAHELYGLDDPYVRIVPAIHGGGNSARQLALLTLAWLHGCLGIHFVLRHRAGYRARFHAFFALALLLPVLAALGFLNLVREIAMRQARGELPVAPASVAAVGEQLGAIANSLMLGFLAVLAVVMLARMGRAERERRLGRSLQLTYPQRRVNVPRGWSVLEASRAHAIAHLSLCGGRARCSTCRVRVQGDPANIPPPSPAELRTLERIHAAPGVRLACQLRPLGDVEVMPLLPAAGAEAAEVGAEREVVVLFVDLRGWSGLSERHLPHDLSYVLDQFFEATGNAVRGCGGVPNQFIGDSVMALFGLETDTATACAQALAAAEAIEDALARLNARLRHEFGHTLAFGIGIHAGLAAVGEVGWRDTRSFTAVGDAVNVAARLQELCKTYSATVVASEAVMAAAGRDTTGLARHEVTVRGRSAEPLAVFALPAAAGLPRTTAATQGQ